MATDPAEFIGLNRTFRDLRVDPDAGDDAELRQALFRTKPVTWIDLLEERRVILLAPAGAGKTVEIRAAAQELREEGKQAFFLRIEHIADHFKAAFEVGDVRSFETWANTGGEGWLLLDSVDEARLASPKDFELAMRMLALHLKLAMHRSHILITGRTSAWRSKSDLSLCKSLFPYNRPKEASTADDSDSKDSEDKSTFASPFRIVALDDLNQTQIERFLVARGIGDKAAFLDAVERANAWSFTSRPQDLEELAGFWRDEGRIGGRLEIMRSSIGRRLIERDQNRASLQPLSAERARNGARLLAAASTFTKQSRLSIPDGPDPSTAISIREVLTGWTEADIEALAARPIFDGAIYGTVRFHHRSVREYLTAEWLHGLLVRQGSRRRIERLFFAEQYGVPIVVPARRPILPWLAILDDRIQDRTLELAPEITFEGGDPAQLSPDTRRRILRQVCEQLAQPAHGRSALDYEAVQRFAGDDIVQDIRELLHQYADDDDIVWFLLRLVWHGELVEAVPEAKHFAETLRDTYARSAAIKVVRTLGTTSDRLDVREAILADDSGPFVRDWLAELIQGLPRDVAAIDWLGDALAKVEPKERFNADSLMDVLSEYIDALSPDLAAQLASRIGLLLGEAPFIERRHCRVSERYRWLAQIASRAIAKTIEGRHPDALRVPILEMLHTIPLPRDYHSIEMESARPDMAQLVRAWPELNHALFWLSVDEARAERTETEGPLVDVRFVSLFGAAWGFAPSDFDLVLRDVETRDALNDRRVALSLAFELYVAAGRPRAWRERLKRSVADDPLLTSDLQRRLKPPPSGRKSWRAQQLAWKRTQQRREAADQKNAERNKMWVQEHLDAIRTPADDGFVTNEQAFLLDRLRSAEEARHHWTDGEWQSLVPEYGLEVAEAFRGGALAHWRVSRSLLLCEGAVLGSTPYASILGLAGLAIEARENPGWIDELSPSLAEIAVRHALRELNGFPGWLPELYEKFPDVVLEVFLKEIAFELSQDVGEQGSNYLLYDSSWSGQWLWDRLAPALLSLPLHDLKSLSNLDLILTILNGSSIPDEALSETAALEAQCAGQPGSRPIWFATWVGVEPEKALDSFDLFLAELPDDTARTQAVMTFATHILGNRRSRATARSAFRAVAYLKRLFVLLHKHVRRREDIERAGKGVYSPGLRDEAQDARDSIFAMLRDIPGKESYLALMDLSLLHPDQDARPWMAFHAKAKAEQDGDAEPWTVRQFVEFNDDLERTPSNHRELWELAVSRLLDLKHDLERGDSSFAPTLSKADDEPELRNFIGGWLREKAVGRYSIPQEEQFVDTRRPDLRFWGAGFDAPVPVEVKIADQWTGPRLFERLKNQLCGDYLRDPRSTRGIFLLIYRGTRTNWALPDGSVAKNFDELIDALRNQWKLISHQYADIEDVEIVGIDLITRLARSVAPNLP